MANFGNRGTVSKKPFPIRLREDQQDYLTREANQLGCKPTELLRELIDLGASTRDELESIFGEGVAGARGTLSLIKTVVGISVDELINKQHLNLKPEAVADRTGEDALRGDVNNVEFSTRRALGAIVGCENVNIELWVGAIVQLYESLARMDDSRKNMLEARGREVLQSRGQAASMRVEV